MVLSGPLILLQKPFSSSTRSGVETYFTLLNPSPPPLQAQQMILPPPLCQQGGSAFPTTQQCADIHPLLLLFYHSLLGAKWKKWPFSYLVCVLACITSLLSVLAAWSLYSFPPYLQPPPLCWLLPIACLSLLKQQQHLWIDATRPSPATSFFPLLLKYKPPERSVSTSPFFSTIRCNSISIHHSTQMPFLNRVSPFCSCLTS